MKDKQNQQNNTSDTGVKYKNIPFNMMLAKLICDGSVSGKIYALWNATKCDVVTYVKPLENGNEVFEVILPSPHDCTEIAFTQNGRSAEVIEHCPLVLCIDVLVEDSCNGNVSIDDFKVQQKDPHYHKCKIEPIEYILANDLGFCEGNVVKYITRYKDKGGIDDLRKIKVYVDYLINELTEQNK